MLNLTYKKTQAEKLSISFEGVFVKPLKIQYELAKRGITQRSIASELKVSDMMISLVVNKKHVSDRIMRAIAEKINREHQEVFPEHYNNTRRREKAA